MMDWNSLCIPMKRDKMRRILARELFRDDIARMKLEFQNHPLQLNAAQKFFDDAAFNSYIRKYYPGDYMPREDGK